MIRTLVDFALNNRFVVIAIALLLVFWGAISFHQLPVEAYPDIADNYVTVITQWPGRSAEEIEQQVTIPIEVQMAGMPHMTFLRSESIFGLSYVIMIFDDSSVNDWNRQKVMERLTQVDLPNGQNLQPQIGTDWSTTGQIYWYTIRSTDPRYDLMQLRSIEDWVLLKEFKSVLNVVDVSDFGGTVREYQVRVDPNKLVSYGLSIGQVEQQLSNNNNNAGGSFVELGMQQMNVRALGLFKGVQDIENTVLTTKNGTALRVKDIAEVQQGPMIRLGHMARANHMEDGSIIDEPDVIQGGVLMRKGAEEQPYAGCDSQEGRRAQQRNPAGRGEGCPHAGPQRPAAFHPAHGDAQPDRRHGAGHHHPSALSAQCPRGFHRGSHDSVFSAVCVDLPGPEPYSREPALFGRSGFWHGRGWGGRDDGKHYSPSGPYARPRPC